MTFNLLKNLSITSVVLLTALNVSAEVRLDKLNQCNEIKMLYLSMKSGDFIKSNTCRSPRGPLERTIHKFSKFSDPKFCFMKKSSLPSFLDDFSCVAVDLEVSGAMTCFRSVDAYDVQDYRARYSENYSKKVRSYLDSIAKCDISNGNASEARNNQLPPILYPIARHEFGFITGLGSSVIASSRIQHGYGKTDPSISDDISSAIEYFDLLVQEDGPLSLRDENSDKIGNWYVSPDDSTEFEDIVNTGFRKNRVPLRMEAQAYDLEKSSLTQNSYSEKLELLENIVSKIGRSLVSEGFREFTTSEFEDMTGVDFDEQMNKSTDQLPYGMRHRVLDYNNMKIYTNEIRPRCTRNGRGGLLAMLFSGSPSEYTGNEYGSVHIVLLGEGKCSRKSSRSTKKFIVGIFDHAYSIITSELR